MYKVFLNDRSISIGSPADQELQENKSFKKQIAPEELRTSFEDFLLNDHPHVVWLHESPSYLLQQFRKYFLELPAAGGVVLRGDRILFIFRNEKWDLPKGKIDRGETANAAALREVEEECGITGHTILKELPSTFHMYKQGFKSKPETWIFKETRWYEMQYSGTEKGSPQTSEGITQLKWISMTDLNQVLENTYENLKQIITLYRA